MYTPEQIRAAGISGEISSIDVEHLINILKRENEEPDTERCIECGKILKGIEIKRGICDECDDWEEDDETDPLDGIAENCTCGAYQWINGGWKHVSDCIC